MTDITLEAVAKGLVNVIDESDPVIAGQEGVIEFTEAHGANLKFTVTADSREQHHFIAALRDASTPSEVDTLKRLEAILKLNAPDQAVEKCRAIITEALEGKS